MLSEFFCLVFFIVSFILHLRELQYIEERCPGAVITHDDWQPEVYNYTTSQFNVHPFEYDSD
jgi:hypothetical protein